MDRAYIRGYMRSAHIIASGVTFCEGKKLMEGLARELDYGADGGANSLW